MTDEDINYHNNPLHGLGLKAMLTELVDHYGFPILDAYLNINCFKTNPSIESSVKFLKKTQWAREKVEVLYLYEYKNLPRASSEQFAFSPRDRIIPEGQEPREPAELSFEDAERLHQKRVRKAAERDRDGSSRKGPSKSGPYGNHAKRNTQDSNRDRTTSSQDESASAGKREPSDKAGSPDPWAKWRE